MKPDYLRQNKELIQLVLFGTSVVLAGLILVKTTSFFTSLARAQSIVQKATEQNNVDENDADKYLTKYKVLAEALKKNNLFAPAPPRQHPVKEVSGIFGSEVLISDKWYKIGDMIGDAKIVSIEPTQAIIEWDGMKKTFLPFDATISEAPKGSQAKKAVVKAGKADMVVIQSGRESMSDRESRTGLRRAFERMRERWPTIYEKQREKLSAIDEKWPTMSEKEREIVGKWLEDPENFEKNKK